MVAQRHRPGAPRPRTAGSSPRTPTTKKNPLADDAKTLAAGKAVYKDKCERCHGPGGLGDGPDADPEARTDMDLTNPKRAARNPDGVVFYKVLNGRKSPRCRRSKDELTEDQIWSVVTYVQSLQKEVAPAPPTRRALSRAYRYRAINSPIT